MNDNLVITRNYKYPFNKIIKEQTLKVLESHKVSLIQYLKYIRIKLDDDVLFTTNYTKNSFTLENYIILFLKKILLFFFSFIELEYSLEKYQRKYYKLLVLIGQFEGIIDYSYMIAMIIYKFMKNSYLEFLNIF